MKRGSALLIVLGMIAFMVISAVAFSALMRHSRLPSSYLRRTSSSRHLVKAALAEAIDIVDISLGNDRHPNTLGPDYSNGGDYTGIGWGYPRDAENGSSSFVARRNYWRGHVFIGSNSLCNASETVSTLTLEGLAYLPPPLINEARYYSRRSSAGRWRNLGFDAGRYAFSVVDVSDYLDINRLFADRGRNSSDSGRITLAHVFDPALTGGGGPDAAAWDEFIAQFSDGGKLPLVSLADLNLAIADKQTGWIEMLSPFCRFIRNNQAFIASATDPAARKVRYMTFTTDSYTPSTNDANSAKYDLCSAQPFGRMLHGTTGTSSQMSYMDQLDGAMTTPILTRLYDKVTELDTVSLYDYLDENDIPTSLALPSVEAVPMIYALKPSVNLPVELPEPEKVTDPAQVPPNPATAADKYYETRTYKLKINNPAGMVEARCLFPFRHCGDQAVSFKLDVAARIGFTIGDGPGFRQGVNCGFAIANESEFKKTEVKDGIIKVYQEASQQMSFDPRNISTEADAFSQNITVDLTSKLNDIANAFQGAWIFKVTYRYDAEAAPPGAPNPFVWKTTPVIEATRPPEINTAFFRPTNADGTGDGGFNVNYLLNNGATCVVKPYMTLTARVFSNRSQATVDLVPAHYADDNGFNSLNTPPEVSAVCGSQRPFLTMAGADPITFSEGAFNNGNVMAAFSPTANGGTFVCPDPRWNFAPENFYVVDGGSIPDGEQFVQNLDLGNGGRDNDIFLMCSNQGYMQSPSEFTFLPRTTNARLPIAGSQYGAAGVNPNGRANGFATSAGTAPYGDLAHGDLMWKTYRVYSKPKQGVDDDNLYNLGITYSGRGYRVNPFTASKEVMMAALANTPYSWYAASTNKTANNNLSDANADEFNKDYAFNEKNSKAKIYWKDLEKVAERFVSVFRGNGGNWQTGFHKQDWDGEDTDLCDVDFESTNADDLYDVDRKMLYGFWRDSFGVKQQLFLIFVRAEPMMMGGGAIGQTPPQLGARAVALVWRDPNPTRTDVGSQQPRPHRTRILFYRQFD